MSWKGRLSRIFVAVFIVSFLLTSIIQKYCINFYTEVGKYSKNDFQRAQKAVSRVYSLENLTVVPPGAVLEIKKTWNDELSQAVLHRNRTLTDHMIQAGGQPERLLLISKWKSGSSYVGTVLRSRPATHYFYEPLNNAYSHFTHEEPEAALRILRNIFQCQNLEQHITQPYSDLYYFSRNSDLMKVVRENQLEWDPNFLTVMCRMSPVLAVKVVRLRLRYAEALLEDEKLNLKVIFLVRDPRATMNSRFNTMWCLKRPDCRNFTRLCAELTDDYIVGRKLETKYPSRFMQLRYEDLLLRSESSKQLLRKLGISSALSSMMGEPQLTKWMSDIGQDMDSVRHIQHACKEAMDLWGYVSVQKLPTELSNVLKSSV